MQELMRHNTTDEQRLLMNTFTDKESATSCQMDMLFAVVYELTERGELPRRIDY